MERVRVFAPVKINLYLHITGIRRDGYHTLDSLVVFADIGDELAIEKSDQFSFDITGPFADQFTQSEHDPDGQNLVVRAARSAAEALQEELGFKITLTKNIPLASGIGGGSADAAATLRALLKMWKVPPGDISIERLLLPLGADVPVCFMLHNALLRGIGEEITLISQINDLFVVLANPGKLCPTSKIFARYQKNFKPDIKYDDTITTAKDIIDFLQEQSNDLQDYAIGYVPEIQGVLSQISSQKGCMLARMSGAGATCFGLFSSQEEADNAAETLSNNNAQWWVKAGKILD